MKITHDIALLLIFVALTVSSWIFGAITHERDMYSNLRKYGDAKAWTCKIYSAEMKDK
jgi:hypothetical protein